MEHHREKEPRLLSQYPIWNRCSTVRRWIWKVSWLIFTTIPVGSSTLSHYTRISMTSRTKIHRCKPWAVERSQHAAHFRNSHPKWNNTGSVSIYQLQQQVNMRALQFTGREQLLAVFEFQQPIWMGFEPRKGFHGRKDEGKQVW